MNRDSTPSAKPLTAKDLLRMSRRELAGVMAAGHPIDPRELDDSEYRGVSLGLPGFVDALLWKTFLKTFHRDPTSGRLRGWNVRLEQTGIDGPCLPRLRRGAPVTFGHYLVVEAKGRPMPRPWDQALFLDYGHAGNAWLDLARWMAAPLVAVNAGRSDLLLGWEFVEIGPLRVSTPAFWSLERRGPLSHRVAPPRRARGR